MNPFRNVYVYFALLIPTTILGFWETYFAILDNLPDKVTPLIHVHASLMFLWLFMLIAQGWFIRTKHFRPHKWVGRSSYVIAPVIILLGLATLHEALNRTPGGVPIEGPVGSRLSVFGFGQMLTFGITWALAIMYRKKTPLHVRFIISTTFAIAPRSCNPYFCFPGTRRRHSRRCRGRELRRAQSVVACTHCSRLANRREAVSVLGRDHRVECYASGILDFCQDRRMARILSVVC